MIKLSPWPMLDVITTKHLQYCPILGDVFPRVWAIGELNRLGSLREGPDLPIDDLDIIDEWRQLQEYVYGPAA